VRCSFSDPLSLSTTFRCTDDGSFSVVLAADDEVNPPVTDTARVTLRNAAPVLQVTEPRPWQVYRAGTTVTLRAPFTDAGVNDTHGCTVGWDDGSTESFAPTAGSCVRTHTYAHAGMYTVSAGVTDDGGADSESVLAIAYDLEGGFATQGGFLDSPAGALTTAPGATGKLQVEFNVTYLNGEAGPAPSGGKVNARLDGLFELGSAAPEWLVVAPDGKVAVKGTGTVNGQAGYGFVVYGYDSDPDRVRLVVWPLSAGPNPGTGTVYDNRPVAGYDLDQADPQPLSGGSLTVHD
jgi:PKD repeat protein